MDSSLNILSGIKDSISLVLEQLNALKKIQDIGLKKLPLYIETVSSLQSSIQNLERIFEDDIPIQHKLKRLVILSLKIDLDEFKEDIDECQTWYEKVILHDESKYTKNINNFFYSCIKFNLCSSDLLATIPSEMLQKLENTFLVINNKIQDVIQLEKTIFGAAISIKHPILQKAWINCGYNQLNDTEISSNIIIESLYNMFIDEEEGKLKNEYACIELITNYVNYIDSLSGTAANQKISISELNKIEQTKENIVSIKGLLGIAQQPNFYKYEISDKVNNKTSIKPDEIKIKFKENSSFLQEKEKYSELIINFVNDIKKLNNTDTNTDIVYDSISHIEENNNIDNIDNIDKLIDINSTNSANNAINNKCKVPLSISFTDKIEIDSTHAVTIPKSSGYGSDWPSILVYKFKIQKFIKTDDNCLFCGVKLKINAYDQGWGGTGHNNVRYQINDNETISGFFIDRNKYPDGLYKFVIPPNQIKEDDIIKVWLLCAPWVGWQASVTKIEGYLKFD